MLQHGVPHKMLTEPIQLFDFDFYTAMPMEERQRMV